MFFSLCYNKIDRKRDELYEQEGLKMQTYLKNGYIVTMGENETVYDGGGVLVEGENIIGQITYTYGDRDVGIANILYNYKKPNMLSQITLSPIDGTPGQTIGPAAENTDKTDLRPIIIGVIIAVVVLAVGFYIIFVEVPYRKKRAAYLARRRRERERF